MIKKYVLHIVICFICRKFLLWNMCVCVCVCASALSVRVYVCVFYSRFWGLVVPLKGKSGPKLNNIYITA